MESSLHRYEYQSASALGLGPSEYYANCQALLPLRCRGFEYRGNLSTSLRAPLHDHYVRYWLLLQAHYIGVLSVICMQSFMKPCWKQNIIQDTSSWTAAATPHDFHLIVTSLRLLVQFLFYIRLDSSADEPSKLGRYQPSNLKGRLDER
jgi:hypothetical protein